MKLKEQKQKEKIEYDQFVIENDRNDLYLEKQKRDALQIKVLEAKKMRDERVQDAKKKRNDKLTKENHKNYKNVKKIREIK